VVPAGTMMPQVKKDRPTNDQAAIKSFQVLAKIRDDRA
jgi:hypothetical protein